ncbi:MAG: reductive dehalogenase [Desulfobacteraceae bacterium]|nr:MAG: reductive dehalogenase [Desulfobacteraceae bacterium]
MSLGSPLTWILFLTNGGFLLLAALFTYESIREQEHKAPRFGLLGLSFHGLLAVLILVWPPSRVPLTWLFGLLLAAGAFFFIPIPGGARMLRGAGGYLAAEGAKFEQMDERDIMFARNRSLRPESKEYESYYTMHPENKAYDDRRRAIGGPLGKPGSIDGSYRPNVSMLVSSFELPNMLGDKAYVNRNSAAAMSTYADKSGLPSEKMDPAKATKIVKGWAKHLGADLVGICKIDRRWAYSHKGEVHYGEWEEWGKEVSEPLPYAVVVATEMDHDMVATAPHTPSVVESGYNYARGAYITTILAQWFGAMGYRAVAEHNRHYDLLMVPLAVDAGLGELGRLGYLIADRYGPRVRLFAVQTDMPLVPDKPVDLGAEKFCEACLKCAESCPSKSIPYNGKRREDRGIERWKLNEETCFEYWGKVGTDCCVCMAVCPYSRPHRSIHKLVRFILRRSLPAQILFPHVDNILYGRRWRPRQALDWMAFPKGKSSKGFPALKGDA